MWRRLLPALWVLLAPAALCSATLVLRPQTWAPRLHDKAQTVTVYAYRQWQSMGIDLEAGDQVRLRASGEWQYSPYVGLHGPEGGGKPVTVPTYPLAGADGGALLGRIGEDGPPFYVGAGTQWFVQAPGRLYLRINDDLLGDNFGELSVTVEVVRATPPPTR